MEKENKLIAYALRFLKSNLDEGNEEDLDMSAEEIETVIETVIETIKI